MSRPAAARVRLALLVALLPSLPAVPAGAQQAGLPIEHSPAHLPVAGFHLDFGQGSGFAGSGRLRSLGGRLHFALSGAQLVLGAHHVSGDADAFDDGIGLQGTVAVQLLEARPAKTMNVQAGLGWLRLESETGGKLVLIDVPVGVAFGLYAPTPLGPAELWAAPRLHLRHADISGNDVAADGTRVGPGASAGVRFTFANTQAGFGLALDGLVLRDPSREAWRFLGSFGLSLHLLLLR